MAKKPTALELAQLAAPLLAALKIEHALQESSIQRTFSYLSDQAIMSAVDLYVAADNYIDTYGIREA